MVKKIHKRPRVSLTITPYEKGLEIFGLALLITYWANTLYLYTIITDAIPIHFDTKGNPDAYGDKSSLLAPPRLAIIFYLLLTFISFFPRYFNYLTEITPENAESEYRKAANTMRYLKLFIVIIFILLSLLTIFTTNEIKDNYFNILILSVSYILLLPLIVYIFSHKINK